MAEKTGIKLLTHYLQKLKSFFFSKDILSFLLFLVISACFWYVHALGKERENNITVPVKYVGMPLNLAITNFPPTEISLNVKDQGIRLFDYSSEHITALNIDVSRNFSSKGQILISYDQLKADIIRYLKPTTTLMEFHPDSILLQYEKLSVKTLPIQLYSKIGLVHQFMLSDKIRLYPNKVTVYGPKHILDTLKIIRTECLIMKNLNDTNTFRVQLSPIKLLRFSTNSTKVGVFVEQFTERKVQLPVTTINCPEHLSVRTFPALVNATFLVGLSQFKKFNANDIQVYLDYNELKANKQSKQVLKIKNNSTHISNIRIFPLNVEFILEQK